MNKNKDKLVRSCRRTSQYSFVPTSAIKHSPRCVFRITQPADLSCHIVLLSPGPIKHLYLFSSSRALLFLSKECPCAHPSNLGPIMEEVSLERRGRGGLLKIDTKWNEGIKDSGLLMIARRRVMLGAR